MVPNTITHWLRLYDSGGIDALCCLETGGSDDFLSEKQIAALKTQLDKHIFQCAKKVCAWVKEQFDLPYSERGMRDLLKRIGYTRQKAPLVPAQADGEAQAAFLTGV